MLGVRLGTFTGVVDGSSDCEAFGTSLGDALGIKVGLFVPTSIDFVGAGVDSATNSPVDGLEDGVSGVVVGQS